MIQGLIKANKEGFRNTTKQKGIENSILTVKSDRPTKFQKRQIAFDTTNFKNPVPTAFRPQEIKEDNVYGAKEFNKLAYNEDPFKVLFGYTNRINPDDHLNPKYYEFKLGNKNENSFIIENLQAEKGVYTDNVEQREALKDFLELRRLQELEEEDYDAQLDEVDEYAKKKAMQRVLKTLDENADKNAVGLSSLGKAGGRIKVEPIDKPYIPPLPTDKTKEFREKTRIGNTKPSVDEITDLIGKTEEYMEGTTNDRSAIIKLNKYFKKAGIEPLTSKERSYDDVKDKIEGFLRKFYTEAEIQRSIDERDRGGTLKAKAKTPAPAPAPAVTVAGGGGVAGGGVGGSKKAPAPAPAVVIPTLTPTLAPGAAGPAPAPATAPVTLSLMPPPLLKATSPTTAPAPAPAAGTAMKNKRIGVIQKLWKTRVKAPAPAPAAGTAEEAKEELAQTHFKNTQKAKVFTALVKATPALKAPLAAAIATAPVPSPSSTPAADVANLPVEPISSEQLARMIDDFKGVIGTRGNSEKISAADVENLKKYNKYLKTNITSRATIKTLKERLQDAEFDRSVMQMSPSKASPPAVFKASGKTPRTPVGGHG